MEDRWLTLDEEEHFGAMKHCLERERLLVASGTLGTNRAWAGRRLLGIQEYRSLILKDNVQSHNSIQVAQSMWISNAPLMLQVKEMRVGQMGWGVENQRRKRCWRHDNELELWCGGMDPGRMCQITYPWSFIYPLNLYSTPMVSHSTCKPWTMNNLGNLLILKAFNDYSPFNDKHVISMYNAGCS